MPFLIKDNKGFVEAIIDPSCGIEKFFMATEILENEFEISYIEKNDSLDTSYWDFEFNDSRITIHYNIYTGISLFSSKFHALSLVLLTMNLLP